MRTALAGFHLEGNGGSWNPGAGGDDWSGGGGGCGGGCGCGGDCGCKGGGGSCGGKPSDGGDGPGGGAGPLPLIPDYDGEIWAATPDSSRGLSVDPSLRRRWLARFVDAVARRRALGYDAELMLMPCICPCLPNQRDVTGQVNEFVQSAIDKACVGAESIPEALEAALVSSKNPFITNIELFLEMGIRQRKDIVGNPCDNKLTASAIVVCGECIGTDKLGHFFEEGLLYSDISEQFAGNPAVDGDRIGEALGYLLEGLDPIAEGLQLNQAERDVLRDTDFALNFAGKNTTVSGSGSFGNFRDRDAVLPPNAEGGQGGADPMDLAANAAGRDFWNDLKKSEKLDIKTGFRCNVQGPFDICDYVDEKWNHMKNKRKQCLPAPPEWVL
jgi:hypothetical protein